MTLFFFLISLGQAYPYSYAWAMGRHEACGCNVSGRKCIHGCDLKKRRQSVSERQVMARHGHAGQETGHSGTDEGHEGHDAKAHAHHAGHVASGHTLTVQALVDDETAPVWVNPDCSRQQRREALSFRSDPFLPQESLIVFQPRSLGFDLLSAFALVGVPAGLDPPPPKA